MEDGPDLKKASDFESFPAEPLLWWERLGSSVIGVACVGGGLYATFRSGNQGGTLALLLVGAAFLLMGLQGTPLVSIGSGDNRLRLERRRQLQRVVARVLADAGKSLLTDR
jgi:hypothetical protein